MISSLKDLIDKKLAIWGFGEVGKAAAKLFWTTNNITLLEKRPLNPDEAAFAQTHHIVIKNDPEEVLASCDLIIPSPGVDLRPYLSFREKFIAELDIFQAAHLGPTIAITGSAGKTTTTYRIAELLKKKHSVFLGGNIGHCLLYALQEEADDYRVLEVSSFQLEYATTFAPDLAIITTLFANHLDRHTTFEEYRAIKLSLLKNQTMGQSALIPLELVPFAQAMNYRGHLYAFSLTKPETTYDFPLYFAQHEGIYKIHNGYTSCLANHIPRGSFTLNWIIAAAALDILGKAIPDFAIPPSPLLEHRLEFCGEHQGIYFYNDSKATIMESTFAALEELGANTILLLGGLSKGVDRQPALAQLAHKVKKIICFGHEAPQLFTYACQATIECEEYCTLEEAFFAALRTAQHGNNLLLSPGGSSFDLFKDYKERGTTFKHLFNGLKNQ